MKKKIMISLSDGQTKALEDLMRSDMATNRSAYMGFLISQEVKNRNKKPVGRPRKSDVEVEDFDDDYTDDLPKNIPHFGEMIGPREYADKEATRASFRPQG